jgi:hypothetical protein
MALIQFGGNQKWENMSWFSTCECEALISYDSIHRHRRIFTYGPQVDDVIPVRAVTQRTGSSPKWRVCETGRFRCIQKPLLSVTWLKRRQTRRIEYSNSHSRCLSILILLSTKCIKWTHKRTNQIQISWVKLSWAPKGLFVKENTPMQLTEFAIKPNLQIYGFVTIVY